MEKAEKHIESLKKDIRAFDKVRKYYKIPSEWHKIMYRLTHELEIYEKVVKTLKNIEN